MLQTIKLNLVPGKVSPVVYASQYDKGREFRCLLFDGEEEYILTTETINICVRKPDGHIVTASVPVVSGNKYVDITTTQQMCAVVGKSICELKISKDDTLIGTLNFCLNVQLDPADGSIQSDSAIHDLQAMVDVSVENSIGDLSNIYAEETVPAASSITFIAPALKLKSLSISANATQESGTPTPTSTKAITGITTVTPVVNGTGYLIDLGDTYYGASITIVDGVTTFMSDRKSVNLADLTWNMSNGVFTAEIPDGQKINVNGVIDYICDSYLVKESNSSTAYSSDNFVLWHGKSASKNWVFVRDNRYSTKQEFQAGVTGVLIYVTINPVTTALPNMYLRTVDGENTISISNGTVSATYYKSVEQTVIADSGNILYGKKWAVCGDSFSNGVLTTTIGEGKYYDKKVTYPWLIGNRNNMEILKFFEGGRTLGFPAVPGTFTNSLTYPSGAYYYQNIPADVDYITIYLGINDCHHATGDEQIPLGTVDDTTTATYLGAYNVVLLWLIENRPNAHIGMIITNGTENNPEYRQGQIAIAQKYGVPYIDMNGDSRTPTMHRTCNPNIASSVKQILIDKWAVSSSNPHPNDAAHRYESTFIEAFLRSI